MTRLFRDLGWPETPGSDEHHRTFECTNGCVIGLYDASLGARSNETSGRAIMARQREGDVSTFHFIDNVRRSIRHTGRILLDLIPRVYTGQRIVRVLGEDGKRPQNVQLGNLAQQPHPMVPGAPARGPQ